MKKLKLGEYLIEEGLITADQLKLALEEQKTTGKFLGEIVVDKGWASKEKVYQLVSSILGVEFIDLSNYTIPKEVLKSIPERVVKKYTALPIRKEHNTLVVAMGVPQDIFAIDEIRSVTKCKVTPVLGIPSQVFTLIDKYYGSSAIEATLSIIRDTEDTAAPTVKEDINKIKESAEKAPVVKLVDAFIMEAVRERASDIHIEPMREGFKIRFRIDGVLHDISYPPKTVFAPVVSRVKIMARMDIAERRVPQDGSFRVVFENREIDVRVSSFPAIYGEKIVMRLLVKEYAFVKLKELGFETDDLEKFNTLVVKTCGIFLVVGPTGSGKSTTLYSALHRINSPEKHIVTVEDPVEYKIDGLVQSQINLKAGYTFANSLRSIMRQDPDIIMVGEIRDTQTAELAVRAALTGHLVLSTLHTNDAPSAVTRLIDMGIEPYLISASLIGAVAQRLVRKICSRCKAPLKKPPQIIDTFKQELKTISDKAHSFYHGKGCEACRNTGYQGREAVFEVMPVSEEMREAISRRESTLTLKRIARKEGIRTLRENGLRKALKGITTLDEIINVIELVS